MGKRFPDFRKVIFREETKLTTTDVRTRMLAQMVHDLPGVLRLHEWDTVRLADPDIVRCMIGQAFAQMLAHDANSNRRDEAGYTCFDKGRFVRDCVDGVQR